jgi:hypothetical protein
VLSALEAIDYEVIDLQISPYWFNVGDVLVPATPGGLELTSVTSVLESDYLLLGGRLFDAMTRAVIETEVTVRCLLRLELVDMPESAARLAVQLAALRFAVDYDADPQQINKLNAQVGIARSIFAGENARQIGMNFLQTADNARRMFRIRGYRYRLI